MWLIAFSTLYVCVSVCVYIYVCVPVCVYILYFAWEDQSEKVCCIAHKVVINCITVLYEPYSTVMHLIGHIQHCYALN